MFEIEKNVPVPDDAYNTAHTTQYPFNHLAVNDSFIVRGDTKTQSKALQAFYYARRRHSLKSFLYAREKDGIRFWRVA